MHRFWSTHLEKLLRSVAPNRVLLAGLSLGCMAGKLLAYCREVGCGLDVVDAAPDAALRDILSEFSGEQRYHAMPSLAAIPLLKAPDLVLLDGDRNWYTVYNELQLLFARAVATGNAAPIVLLANVCWPYARRDMYHNPAVIPDRFRHDHAFRGIVMGQSELADGGLNGGVRNALHEGGLRNGVLTALEDFVAGWNEPAAFRCLPFFNGLGILIPQVRHTEQLDAVVEGFFGGAQLLEICGVLEREAMDARTELAAARLDLTRKSEALVRARARIVNSAIVD